MASPQDARLSAIEATLADLVGRLPEVPRSGRGRPAILPAALLWAGMLVCLLHQEPSQRAIWRLLAAHGLLDAPRIPISDDAVYRRIQRTGPTAIATLYGEITDLLRAADAGDQTLAPFATEVVALDETTLDPVTRRAGQRDLPPGDDRLIPGKASALFDVRRQLFRTVRLGDDFRQNEKVGARALVGTLPVGSLLVADLGYFAFAFMDDLTDSGYHWVMHCRDKTSYTVAHVFWQRAGHRDALVWLGGHRADRTKHLVRLLEVRHGRTTRRYLTNVTDPALLALPEVVRLYARRWDIELAIKAVKRDLGLRHLWSGQWAVIQTQVWATLIIAQRAGVDLFAVSLTLLLRDLPRFVARGEDPIATIAGLGPAGGFIRPSRRIRYTVPDPDHLVPPPPDLLRVRPPRYAGRRCGPHRTDRHPT